MLTTLALPRRRSPRLSKIVAAVVCAMTALNAAGITRPATAENRPQQPPGDRRVLSDIARNVLRDGATGLDLPVGQPSLPGWPRELSPEPDSTVPDVEPAEGIVFSPIAPVREGITVPIDPGGPRPKKVAPDEAEAAGYQSNSWRQRTDTGRGLSFSSGRLAPASGLDPALAAGANSLRAKGRQYVYGFLLLRAPVDAALEKTLAGLDVRLLGPHDDHYKARLPIASLQAIAALPAVEWVA